MALFYCLPRSTDPCVPEGGSGGTGSNLVFGTCGDLNAPFYYTDPSANFQGRLQPQTPTDYDAYGSLSDIVVPAAMTAKYYIANVTLVPLEPCDAMPCGGPIASCDYWCNARVERVGDKFWKMNCRQILQQPNQPLEDPNVFVPFSRRQTFVMLEYGPGGNGNVLVPYCFATLSPHCFTRVDSGQQPAWHEAWNYIDIDWDVGISTTSDATRDLPVAFRQIQHDAIQQITRLCSRVDHGNRSFVTYTSNVLDLWDWGLVAAVDALPVIQTAVPLRLRGMSTGVDAEFDLVLTLAAVSLNLSVVRLDTGHRVIAEFEVDATIAARRKGANSFQRTIDGQTAAIDLGSDRMNTLAAVTHPAYTATEQFLLQAYDATTDKWVRVPTFARWRGLLGPSPYSSPGWYAASGFQSCDGVVTVTKEQICCTALQAVEGTVIPRERVWIGVAGDDEYTGDVVLRMTAGLDCTC